MGRVFRNDPKRDTAGPTKHGVRDPVLRDVGMTIRTLVQELEGLSWRPNYPLAATASLCHPVEYVTLLVFYPCGVLNQHLISDRGSALPFVIPTEA
jgi:hypothetical protein